jgi:2-hydroxy-3-keto-5-methylthiopentenyl-1-phosphate phosphatase
MTTTNRYIITIVLLFATSACPRAAAAPDDSLGTRLAIIEDRVALKELVDTFSNLADQKETDKQTLLFTEDAELETISGGKSVTSLRGRAQIGEAFRNFLAGFETVYHANGQLVLTLNGDSAAGTSYCLVTLVANADGKKMATSIKVYYQDTYVRHAGRWLISKRKATFAVRETRELTQ